MDNIWLLILVSLLCLALGFFVGVFWQTRRSPTSPSSVTNQIELLTKRALQDATDRLQQTQHQSLERLNEHVSHEKQLSSQSLSSMVNPVTSTLQELRSELGRLQEETKLTHGRMHAELQLVNQSTQQLHKQTHSLVSALKSSNTRGQWGEMQLRRIVEAAGMLDRVDFFTQDHRLTDQGSQRPDMVVKLAGGKHIVIDAKAPLSAFLESTENDDPSIQQDLLSRHAKQMRQLVTDLAKKQYWTSYENSPEFVVLFVPNDTILSSATQSDPSLFDYAMSQQVVIATPSTLLALLRSVAFAWQQDALAENAQDILQLGKLLHERLSTMHGHLADVGKKLGQSVDGYNKLLGSLESRVLPAARRFGELGISGQPLDSPMPVHQQPRNLSATEFID